MKPDPANHQLSARHIPALDGYRGVAILLVLVWHLWPRNSEKTPWFISFGWTGVDLFFVLSGFLITRLLLAAKGNDRYFRSFYARRTLRIFPLYYATLAVVYIAWPRVDSITSDWFDASIAGAYLTNLWSARTHLWFPAPFPFNGSHLWSLAIEEQFYLAWPMVVLLLARKPLALTCGLLAVISIVCRVIAWRMGLPQIVAYVLTLSHMDGLALGAAMAVIAMSPAWITIAIRACFYILPVSTAGLIAVFIRCRSFDVHVNALVYTIGISLLPPFFSSLLFLTMALPAKNILDRAMHFPPLRWFGKYSYGLYLFQGFLVFFFQLQVWQMVSARFGTSIVCRLCQLVLSAAVCSVLAFFSYHLFERQLMSFKPTNDLEKGRIRE